MRSWTSEVTAFGADAVVKWDDDVRGATPPTVAQEGLAQNEEVCFWRNIPITLIDLHATLFNVPCANRWNLRQAHFKHNFQPLCTLDVEKPEEIMAGKN